MTRYMQAIGFYLALSGFGFKELLALTSRSLILGVGAGFTALNVLAFYAAGRFRSMAKHARDREKYYASRYDLQSQHELFWGYWLGILLVGASEAGTLLCVLWETHYRILFP